MADDDIAGVANQVRGAMGAVESALDSFNRKLRTSIGSDGVFTLADRALGSMAKTMLGPVGLAAGFVGVAKALESVAASAMSMQYLARDAGFASKSVSEMQGAFRMMGAGVQDANRSIGNLGEKLQSLAVFREGSDIWQGMAKFPGAGAEIANTLMGIAQEGMRSGNQMKALDEMLRLFNKQSPETKFAWAQVWGESVSHLENMARKLAVVQKLGIPQWSKDEEERYLELMVGWELRVENIWKRVAHHGMQAMNDTSKSMEEMGVTSEKVVGFMNSVVDQALKTLGQDVKDFVAIANMLKRVPENFRKATSPVVHYPQGEDPMGDDYTRKSDGGTATFPLDSDPMGADYTRPPSMLGRYRGWLNNQRWLSPGPRSSVGTSGSTDFSGRRRTVADSWLLAAIPGSGIASMIRQDAQPGEDQHAMRSMLRRWAGISDPGEEAPWAQGGEWHKTRVTDFGGRRRTDDLVEVEKDSSKTLVDIRDILQRMETGSSGGGDTPMFGQGIRGGNMQASLGGFRKYRGGGSGGLSSADDGVGAGLSGSEFMAARRARFAEEAKDPELRERLMAMMSSEGTPKLSLESLANRMDYAGRKLSAGLTPAFYGPMRNGLFDQHLAKVRSDPALRERYSKMIDDVLVRGSNELGGRTDQGMPSDPNGMWGYGSRVWMKRGGNVFTDWGGGPGGHAGAARYREMIERGVAGEIARKQMDAQAADKWSGGINAKVEFLNVPGGVKTSADSEGDVFRQLQISRTKQMGVYNNPSLGYE